MKSKTKLIILTSSLVLAVAGAGVGVTYAAFTASDTFPVTAQVGISYLKTYVYLDGSQTLGDGKSWDSDSSVIWAHSYYQADNGTCSEILWSPDTKGNSDTYHRFEISEHANRILFLRFKAGDTIHDTSKNLLNQTDDIIWAYVVDGSTNKLFTITAWTGGKIASHSTYTVTNYSPS